MYISPFVRLYAVAGSSVIVAAAAYKQWSTGSIFGPTAKGQGHSQPNGE